MAIQGVEDSKLAVLCSLGETQVPSFKKQPLIFRIILLCYLGVGQWVMTVMASTYGSDKNQLKLYSHWRSSCSVRVRIALNLKGLNYEYRAVNLLKGAQFSAEFTKLNPLGHVPVLMDGDIILADSFAIIMYLEEKYPQHSLLPKDLQKRGINYQAANIVSSSIQPFQNQGTLHLKSC